VTITPSVVFASKVTTSLANQPAQDGDAGSYVFEGLVVPFLLYKTAKEVMNSTLVANSGENNLNIFDTDYGTVAIRASVFLGSTYNGATNANTSYHVLSTRHIRSMTSSKLLRRTLREARKNQYRNTEAL